MVVWYTAICKNCGGNIMKPNTGSGGWVHSNYEPFCPRTWAEPKT